MAQPTMAQETEHRCVQCDKVTTLRCKGCDEGVDKYGKESITFYCSKECQIAHRATHKSECKNANYRKQLFRTANIAKNLFFGVRKLVYMFNIEGAVKKDGIIRLTEGEYDNAEVIFDFPDGLFAGVEDREAVLAHWSSAEAFVWMNKFITSALEGATKNIKAVCVIMTPGNERVVSKPIAFNGGNMPHTVLKVDLKDGTSYTLDICAVHYGLYRVVTPWDDYCKLLVSEVKDWSGAVGFGDDVEKQTFLKKQQAVVGRSDAAYGQIVRLFHGNVVRLMYCAINTWTTKSNKDAAEMVTQKRPQYTEDFTAFYEFVTDHIYSFATLLKDHGVAKIVASVQDLVGWYLRKGLDVDRETKLNRDKEPQPKVLKKDRDFMWPEMEKAWRELEKAREKKEPKFHMMETHGGQVLHIWGDK